MRARILLIDDDSRLPALLKEFLEQNDMHLSVAGDGAAGLKALEHGVFDAVLLDVMMPGLDGLEVLRRIRKTSRVPLIMLTARGDETDRVVGLEIGADDYVSKPFSPRELLARIKAVLRRAQPEALQEKLSAGDVQVVVPSRETFVAGKSVELTGLEFDLLVALMRRAGRVVPRDALLSEAGRGDLVVGERTVDVHISHLRQKLGDDAGRRIKTVRGVGYSMVKD